MIKGLNILSPIAPTAFILWLLGWLAFFLVYRFRVHLDYPTQGLIDDQYGIRPRSFAGDLMTSLLLPVISPFRAIGVYLTSFLFWCPLLGFAAAALLAKESDWPYGRTKVYRLLSVYNIVLGVIALLIILSAPAGSIVGRSLTGSFFENIGSPAQMSTPPADPVDLEYGQFLIGSWTTFVSNGWRGYLDSIVVDASGTFNGVCIINQTQKGDDRVLPGSVYSKIQGRIRGSNIAFRRSIPDWRWKGFYGDYVGSISHDGTMAGTFSEKGHGSYSWSAER
jgi:hypothetical protein